VSDSEQQLESNVIALSEARQSKFRRLYDEAKAIELEDARTIGEIGYINKVLVQATLPYREPKPKRKGDTLPAVWGRTAGDWSLIIQPGGYLKEEKRVLANGKIKIETTPVSLGYPFGSKPRLILAWLGREIKLQKSPEIKLGRSLAAFLEALGIESATGGAFGSITHTREQMRRLFSSRIALVQSGETKSSTWEMNAMQVADKQNLWWDPKTPEQGGLFESTVVLSQKFYDEFKTGVPVDMRALRALKSSPFELDLYCWLTHRFFSLQRRVVVPWEALHMQFGTETVNLRKFKWQIQKALRSVLVVYPEAKVDPTQSGLLLLPSPTSVRRLANLRAEHPS